MNTLLAFFHEMAPSSHQIGWGTAVSCFGTFFSYLIGWNDVIEALIVAMAIDYITGLMTKLRDSLQYSRLLCGFSLVMKGYQ